MEPKASLQSLILKDDCKSLIAKYHVWTAHALANVNICLQMSTYICLWSHSWMGPLVKIIFKSVSMPDKDLGMCFLPCTSH